VHYLDLFAVFARELAYFVGQLECRFVVAIVYVQSHSPVGAAPRWRSGSLTAQLPALHTIQSRAMLKIFSYAEKSAAFSKNDEIASCQSINFEK
jgi:hypothetical protein